MVTSGVSPHPCSDDETEKIKIILQINKAFQIKKKTILIKFKTKPPNIEYLLMSLPNIL